MASSKFSEFTRVIFAVAPGAESQRSRKACDNCHRRKVRCRVTDTGNCRYCASRGISCTFLLKTKSRGRKVAPTSPFRTIQYQVPLEEPTRDSSKTSQVPLSSSPTLQTIRFQAPLEDPRELFRDPFLPSCDFSIPHFHDLAKYALNPTKP